MKYYILLFVAFTSHAAFAAQKYDLSKQETSVEFLAVGKPSMLKINGTGAKLSGQIEVSGNQISGDCTVALNQLTTGIDLRDKHMKEKYLETAKYPEATFTISKIDLPLDFVNQKKSFSAVPFEGKMKVKNVEKEVRGLADVDTSTANLIKVSTEFKSQISSFQMDIPTYLGVKVADEVTVKTTMQLKK